MAKSRDLFDDSTMTFGEHLEVLRTHLWKALLGLFACVAVTLYFSDHIVAVIRAPIDRALKKYEHAPEGDDALEEFSFGDYLDSLFGDVESEDEAGEPSVAEEDPEAALKRRSTITIRFKASELAALLHEYDPQNYPLPVGGGEPEPEVKLKVASQQFAQLRELHDEVHSPVTLNVQEAFMTYLKVAFVAGLVLGAPWIFYQIWQFVAAGLYPHERKYVHIYLPISTGLFLAGVLLCFYGVFPFVLNFLLGFNRLLGVFPNIRLSEWITFALMLPVMFGVSFQLPLVMLFLERISIFRVEDYREKRRISILVIAIISMMLTPAEPISMMMMMLPMLGLYEMGIWLCTISPSSEANPFETA